LFPVLPKTRGQMRGIAEQGYGWGTQLGLTQWDGIETRSSLVQ
jgi:hypothetical protein